MSTNDIVVEGIAGAQGSGNLLDEIMAQTKIAPNEEGYDVAKKGVAAFISNLLHNDQAAEPVNKNLVDQMLVELDRKISAQMDEVLHDESIQQMESAWRGLKLLVDRTDFRENNKIDLIHVTKSELLEDFEFAPETTQSGLYKHVYSSGYGQFGGEPTGAIIGNYAFTPSSPDIKLLQYMSSLGAMAHAPFISSVGPEFFGIESFEELANLKDLNSIFAGPKYTKWRSLRESEDARYLGLTAPRFLLRVPYDPIENPIKSFNYQEDVSQSHSHYLWGNTAYAFASKLTDSFAKYRWCPNIIGPQSGGSVEDLPVHAFESMGELQTKIPTEVLVTDRKEFELAEEGFIPEDYAYSKTLNVRLYNVQNGSLLEIFTDLFDVPEMPDYPQYNADPLRIYVLAYKYYEGRVILMMAYETIGQVGQNNIHGVSDSSLFTNQLMFVVKPEIDGDQLRGPYVNVEISTQTDKHAEIHAINVDYEFSKLDKRLTQNT